MMLERKKIFADFWKCFGAALLCVCLAFGAATPCIAAECAELPENSTVQIIDLGNGLILEEITTVFSPMGATIATAQKSGAVKDGSTVIAEFTVKGSFRYDGTSVSVVSKELTRCVTYNGWSFSSKSLTSSGGTITFSGTLKKFLSYQDVTFTLSCDKNGTIT